MLRNGRVEEKSNLEIIPKNWIITVLISILRQIIGMQSKIAILWDRTLTTIALTLRKTTWTSRRTSQLRETPTANNIRKVYHTIDYDSGRNKNNQFKRKKFGSNNTSQNSSNSLARSNKFIVSNDFIFSSNQYHRGSGNLDNIMSIQDAINNTRKPNNGIINGLSNMKRRKKQQEINANEIQSFGSSFRGSNDRLPEEKHQVRDYFKTRYNSFKNSPLMGSSKGMEAHENTSLATIYKKNNGLKNFWHNSSITNTSMDNIKKNRSRDGLLQQNARQNFHLKIKK